MENLLIEELNLECLKPKGTLAQQIAGLMGYKKITLNIIDIEKQINDTKILSFEYRALALARIAKTIRQERIIHVCAWHKPKQAWWDGEEWNTSDIPPGKYTHTMCEACYEQEMKEVKILREQAEILKELGNG